MQVPELFFDGLWTIANIYRAKLWLQLCDLNSSHEYNIQYVMYIYIYITS